MELERRSELEVEAAKRELEKQGLNVVITEKDIEPEPAAKREREPPAWW